MNLAWLPTPCNILAGKCKDLNFPCTQLKMSQLLVEMSGLHHVSNPEQNLRAANASLFAVLGMAGLPRLLLFGS